MTGRDEMISVKESLSTIALLCQRFGIPTNSLPIPEASSNHQESNAIGDELIHKSEKKLESVLGVIKATEIEEELLIEEIAIDSFSRDSPIPSAAIQSLDLEVIIPSYFFEEEDVDSLDELIPSFFFDEARTDSITTVVYTMATRSVSSQFQEIGNTCFSVLPDYSRLLFDRGKDFKLIQSFSCFAGISEFSLDTPTLCSFALYARYSLMANYNDLIHQLGYQFDWSFGEAIVGLLAECGFPRIAGPLFDKIPGSAVWNLGGVRIDYLLQLKICSVFDQRKEIELRSRNFSFTKYPEIVSHLDMLLKLLDGYYRVSLPNLIHEQGVSSAPMLGKIFQKHSVCLQSRNVINHPNPCAKSLIDSRVFDRGKGMGTIIGYSYFTSNYGFRFASYFFVLPVCSILNDANSVNFVDKLFGFRFRTFYMRYILLVFKPGGTGDPFLWYSQMLLMWRAVNFLLQLKCGFLDKIAVHYLDSLDVNIEIFKCTHSYTTCATSTVIHHGFLILKLWHFLLHMLLSSAANGGWFDRILRANSASFREEFSQAIMGLSSEDNSAWIQDISFGLPHGLFYDRGDTFCGAMTNHLLCSGCSAIFILSIPYSQPRPFNTSCSFALCDGGDVFLLLLKTMHISHKLIVDACLFLIINSAQWIYDRGKFRVQMFKVYTHWIYDRGKLFQVQCELSIYLRSFWGARNGRHMMGIQWIFLYTPLLFVLVGFLRWNLFSTCLWSIEENVSGLSVLSTVHFPVAIPPVSQLWSDDYNLVELGVFLPMNIGIFLTRLLRSVSVDRGNVKLTEKATDLFVWETFILVRASHHHLSIKAVTFLPVELKNSWRWKIAAHSIASFCGRYSSGAAPNSLVTATSMTDVLILEMANVGNTAITMWMSFVPKHKQLSQRIVRTIQVQEGANAHCAEGKLMATPISCGSSAMCSKSVGSSNLGCQGNTFGRVQFCIFGGVYLLPCVHILFGGLVDIEDKHKQFSVPAMARRWLCNSHP